jgi:hypothetical protein
MVILQKEINGEILKTEFEFDDHRIKLVKDVIKCLKDKTIDIPTEDQSYGEVKISILDWFPHICGKVKLDTTTGRFVQATRPAVLMLLGEDELPENAFVGQIVLSRELLQCDDAFCYSLAHELQHAINTLKFVYLALRDWKWAKENIVKIHEEITALDSILDGDSREEELEILSKTFGSSIYKWQEGYIKFIDDVMMK